MSSPTDAYRHAITRHFATAQGKPELFRAAVNAPFVSKVEAARMCLGIVVLLVAERPAGIIHRVALSDTELAKGTTTISVKKFEDIKIPLDEPKNIIAEAIRSGKPQSTADWYYLFTPALTAEEARFNQAGGAIAYSAVYPLAGKTGGALIFSYYQYPEKIGGMQESFMDYYSTLVNEQLHTYL
jgi:hypothetical protein